MVNTGYAIGASFFSFGLVELFCRKFDVVSIPFEARGVTYVVFVSGFF